MNKHDSVRVLQCDVCGRFIAWRDLDPDEGEARRTLLTPDSDYSTETYETLCARCASKEDGA